MKDRTAQLIEKRKRLAEQKPDPSTALTGSRMSRMVRCNKPNCRRCQKGGKGHGPIWILSVRESQGGVRQITVPQHLKPEVEEGLTRFAEMQSLLRQIGEVNQQFLAFAFDERQDFYAMLATANCTA